VEHPPGRQGLLCAAALWGTAWLGWLGFASTGLGAGTFGWLLWCWFVPLPYFAAWFALTLPEPRRALLPTAPLALASAGLAVVGAVAGFFSAGVLALPAFVGCGALFGWAAALLHRTMEPRWGNGPAAGRLRRWSSPD
jgi:hypothetical protein